ncbi:MAG: arginine decarboxylase, pyruvoyl-dependent [candidate division NC10 bacterium]|nr:arginine decarboxylase, pyruvoyl-dependent [candidate division NC10 bacterium]MCH7897554.1 arginine decarboxylase, pyruvoyl-dependent [candidate division NC10 bacterium]MCZ6550490.1 arginine decarboxylase, pyruvoyl-dependent [candidate division NC10 bacterium]
MLVTPVSYTLAVGAAEGTTPLNAFDNALLAAGIGNVNLIKVSSILPPGTKYLETLEIPPGSLVPTAYGTLTSGVPGERIAAAVGVGLCRESFGVIMEYEGKGMREEAEAKVAHMLEAAFERRQMKLDDVRIRGVDYQVQTFGSVVAAAVLWY